MLHFAGQFGGARAHDGATPPTMLLQFVALLVKRHHKFLGLCERAHRSLLDATGADDAAERGGGGGALRGSGRSAIHHLDGAAAAAVASRAADPGGEHGGGGGVRAARDVLGDLERVRHVLRPCEAKLKRYVETCDAEARGRSDSQNLRLGLFFSLSRYNAGLGINVRVPPGAGPEHACAPEQPLRKVQRLLGRILPDPSPEALAAAVADAAADAAARDAGGAALSGARARTRGASAPLSLIHI